MINRKDFIRLCIASLATPVWASPLLSDTSLNGISKKRKKDMIRFGICSDVHQDLFPDIRERIAAFVDEMNRQQVDFVIQLGDFCFPRAQNQLFLDTWNRFEGTKYHVIGNHDAEVCSKQEFMQFVQYPSEKSYYSFDTGGYHFVVLDLNFALQNGEIVSCEPTVKGKREQLNCISNEQYDWLEQDLAQTRKPTILFSHQTLNEELGNRERFDSIVAAANRKSPKVIAAFSGHDHQDWCKQLAGVHHCQINSLCYDWVGSEYTNTSRYPSEVYKKYPNLAYMLPYRDPLYAIVELNPKTKTIAVTGKQSVYVGVTPDEMGMPKSDRQAPRISNRLLHY